MKMGTGNNKILKLAATAFALGALALTGCGQEEDAIVLRVSNWEEYMDEGDWDEEEYMELDNGVFISSENSMVEDFEEWFYETYGKKVVVEYSTFGTNEELYNQITIGDVYDVVCPSEYMIMKMMNEDMVEPFSADFRDKDNELNYYAINVSPYIDNRFEELSIDGNSLIDYAAGYMWGTLGIVYNPEYISKEEASHWDILLNDKYYRQVTIKDSVRDAYFAGAAIYYSDIITKPDFINSPDLLQNLTGYLNATDKETVDGIEDILSRAKGNVYSFETDAGKADMVTGKVLANQQWSGDAVYTLDQAEEDGYYLCYAAPEEATNLWFDGWCMLKAGIGDDADKKLAAEAFINFVSRPDNAIRNMYYIGYTSVISGADSGTIKAYIDYNYAAEDDAEEVVDYDISYFFGEETIVEAEEEQLDRQLAAQYPTIEVLNHGVVMAYFDKEGNERINRMWTNVRCFDIMSLFD